MKFSKPLPRRTFLRSAGISIGLPLLEAMAPVGKTAFAANQKTTKFMACYCPTGFKKNAWGQNNTDIADSDTLGQLNSHKNDLLVLRGVTNIAQDPNKAGGAHAHGTGAFLTGVRIPADKKSTKYPQGNPSLDQRMAELFGAQSPIASLQLTAQPFEAPKPSNNAYQTTGDTGYSPVWNNHISWGRDGNRKPNLWSPAQVFEELFGSTRTNAPVNTGSSAEKSVLDFVMADIARLEKNLGDQDKKSLENYLEGVRDLEKRLGDGGGSGSCNLGNEIDPMPAYGNPEHAEKIIDMMGELAVKAFQCDATRIVTLMYDQGAPTRKFDKMFDKTFKGESHHFTTHKKSMDAHAIDIEKWEIARFKLLLDKLKNTNGVDGSSLMESALVFLSSEVNEGEAHGRYNMPVIIAGRANGRLKTGRYTKVSDNGANDFCNLFETFLDIMGEPDHGKFGDYGRGKGKVGEILA